MSIFLGMTVMGAIKRDADESTWSSNLYRECKACLAFRCPRKAGLALPHQFNRPRLLLTGVHSWHNRL